MYQGSYADLLNSLTPQIYKNLKTAVERRKWPDGRLLRDDELELCMQAVIAYEEKNIQDETIKTAYIPQRNKAVFLQHVEKNSKLEPSVKLKWSQSS